MDGWPRLAAALTEVRAGRGDDLLRTGDEFAGDGNYGEGAYAIGCMDEERLTQAQAGALRARIYSGTPSSPPEPARPAPVTAASSGPPRRS